MIIYVDRTAIEKNKIDGGNRPPFVVVCDGQETNVSRVKIVGECELIYDPLNPPIPGAVAYLKTESEIIISSQ